MVSVQLFSKGRGLILPLWWAGVLLLASEQGERQTQRVAGEGEVLENKLYFVKWLEDTLS